MKKWTLVLGGLLLIMSFQNCQKSNLPTDATAASEESNEYTKTSASGYPTLQIWDYENGKTMDLDVASGRMAVYTDFGDDRGADVCLNDSERQELQALLSSAEICKPVLSSEQFTERVCTQSYRYPYAVLVDQGDEVRLGERTNGCDVPTDLCGAQAQALKNFVQGVLANLEQRACH